jgi:hypothetical protein
MKKPVPRKPQKPTREVKHRVTNPRAAFALQADMITEQEYEAILTRNASLEQGTKEIMNLNAPLPNFPTGTKQTLYAGRGTIVTARNFLEL